MRFGTFAGISFPTSGLRFPGYDSSSREEALPPEVKDLAVDPDIQVTGTVEDIRPYLRGAAIAVAPMRIARGVQNKILEALAMDIPVVASSIAAAALPPELALLVEAESEPKELAARIAEYVLSPPERNGSIRNSVGHYMETLDLPSQLEQFVRSAAAEKAVEENPVEVAV